MAIERPLYLRIKFHQNPLNHYHGWGRERWHVTNEGTGMRWALRQAWSAINCEGTIANDMLILFGWQINHRVRPVRLILASLCPSPIGTWLPRSLLIASVVQILVSSRKAFSPNPGINYILVSVVLRSSVERLFCFSHSIGIQFNSFKEWTHSLLF